MTHRVTYTGHANIRRAQRNLSPADIDFVYRHGCRIRAAGALHIFLGRRHLPNDRATLRQYARLEGTVLVLEEAAQDATLITAYRNRRGLKQIRAKTKYDRRGRRQS
jgi:hypothetical protein